MKGLEKTLLNMVSWDTNYRTYLTTNVIVGNFLGVHNLQQKNNFDD